MIFNKLMMIGLIEEEEATPGEPVERVFLTPSDAGGNDQFGGSCALSDDGTVLAVGAINWDGTSSNQGGVYIYDWSGSDWVQRGSVLTASDAGDDDYFGSSCALSDDGLVLTVGAYGWDGTYGDQGGVYTYDWSGSAWIQRGSVLTASDAGAGDYFGSSCALSDDGTVLAVGAERWDGAAGLRQGAVYIYDWSGSAWVQRGSVLTASDAGASDYFGESCALSDDGLVLTVGAWGWDGPAGSAQGGVYTYDWSGSAWIQRGSVLTASDAGASDFFGSSCALSDDGLVLTVGAINWDGTTETEQGAVYIYDWSGSDWIQRGSVLTASDAASDDYFGSSCALSADGLVLTVGAYGWNGPAGVLQGAIYTYDIT
jgi:hypothetical protein